jgi:hypothetical protein
LRFRPQLGQKNASPCTSFPQLGQNDNQNSILAMKCNLKGFEHPILLTWLGSFLEYIGFCVRMFMANTWMHARRRSQGSD